MLKSCAMPPARTPIDSSLLEQWEKMRDPNYQRAESKEVRPPGAEEAARSQVPAGEPGDQRECADDETRKTLQKKKVLKGERRWHRLRAGREQRIFVIF